MNRRGFFRSLLAGACVGLAAATLRPKAPEHFMGVNGLSADVPAFGVVVTPEQRVLIEELVEAERYGEALRVIYSERPFRGPREDPFVRLDQTYGAIEAYNERCRVLDILPLS